jgi:peptidoglycan/xylan/chitin deacetylase (PgdA/CDA1 family)
VFPDVLPYARSTHVRLCAISVDLDEIPNYFAIYGLEPPTGGASTAGYDVAFERLERFAEDARLPLTLFAIGADLARDVAAERLRGAHARGHEIANHSLDHRYDLVRLGREEILRQVDAGARAIERVVGERPIGFRAPGYTITDEVFGILREVGVHYDSSVFPCPAYFAAKMAAIGAIALRGRKSQSIVDTPAILLAPTRPYFVGTPYWTRGGGLLEIPLQVTRGARLPFYGTSITVAGPTGAGLLAKMCVGEPLVNIELHPIDVLDADDGLEALRPHQPDVRIPRGRKLASLHAAVEVLRKAGYSFVTLREAAKAFV